MNKPKVLKSKLPHGKSAAQVRHAEPRITGSRTTKAAPKSEQLLEKVFASPYSMIAYLDRDCNFIRVNQAYARADGRDASFFPGKNHFALFPDAENKAIFRRVLETGEPYYAHAKPFSYAEHPERGTSYWDWSLFPLHDSRGQVDGLVLNLVDVTERMHAELELRQARDQLAQYARELEQRVAERTHQLQSANEELEVRNAELGVEIEHRASAEAQLRLQLAALESAANGIVVTDRDGTIVWVNPAFTRLTGYMREEVIGRNPRVLKSGEHNDAFYRQLWQSILSGQVWHGEMMNRQKNGTLYVEEMTITPVRQTGNEITHFVAIKQDVTERKRAEEALQKSEERYRTLFTNMTEGFALGEALFDETGTPTDFTFLEINDAFEQQSGLERADVVGKPITQVLPQLERSWIDRYGSVARTGQSIRFDSYNRDTNRHYDVFCYCPVAGRFAILFRDISVEKRASDALQESMERIQKLNQDLALHAEELAAANQELEAFSYSISHDLRTPLSSVEGFSKLLLEEYADKLDPTAQNYARLVHANARHAIELISGLLSFSRYSRQPLNKRPVQMKELVNQALVLLCPEKDAGAMEISVGDLPPCEGDPVLLEQVWVNLIGNAIKYSRKRLSPRIEVGSKVSEFQSYTAAKPKALKPRSEAETPRSGQGETIYYVRDNGVGFDMANAQHLFGVFQRLHDSDEYEGSGVGLAIVQRIVQRHGGRIWAEAAADQGATFYFTLGEAKSHVSG